MSLPGKDLRQEIPSEIHAVLKAYAEAHDRTLASVVIEVLGDWTDRQIHMATVMHHALVVAGIVPERAVATRNVRTTTVGDAT
jgi:hypothetical protein